MKATQRCIELPLDNAEFEQRPRNEVEGGQQGGHVVGPEPGEYAGMPPQGPPSPCQRHGGIYDYYGDLLCRGCNTRHATYGAAAAFDDANDISVRYVWGFREVESPSLAAASPVAEFVAQLPNKSTMDLRAINHKRQRSDDSSTIATRKRRDETGLLPPSGLAHLPEEVLLLILDTILGALVRCHALADVLQHVAALHNLCLTNKKFSRLATPYLCTFISNRNRRKLPQTIDAMILDSKKAESIKHISWALQVKRSSQVMLRRSPKAETMFLQKLGRLGIPELAGGLRACFRGDSAEYHLATALVLAPNLEYLEAADVNYEQETVDGIIWRPIWLELLAMKALLRPTGLSQHFQRLHHLYLGMGELRFEQIGPLLRLPALRTLHLVGEQHNGRIAAQPWNKEVSDRCSTIETLIFECCEVSSQIVAQILDAIKHLKVLKLELNYWSPSSEDDGDFIGQQLSWPTLSRAISAHKESLERLYLVDGGSNPWEAHTDWADTEFLVQEHLECLRDLPNLRYLDTSLMPFPKNEWVSFHHMFLPRLEHLVINVEDIQSSVMNASSLQDLAANCRSRLPLLQDVLVLLPQKRHPTILDFSACKTAFESQGVYIVILISNNDEEEPIWKLHPSTVEQNSKLGSDSWGCRLKEMVGPMYSSDRRARAVFHGPHSAYHDPNGWSIIDDLRKGKS
ncbi:uncharacterized protein M421DRAFT_393250 [Didymella exigua CBS 183.55]|uniref:F-box domain-containing protein n=1 Tax=Didymella exigua CBS 183.55 TaxID=1150837 RepID=A0A6A5RL22_9PLEO|nr:uncharacterized protein M421DRAFT_393250 [Didymella exigua CBS 183.55]KAF1927674.1 hypothetical protein M421DRAFT_393250 [Didymella exigua CBS 183.55]